MTQLSKRALCGCLCPETPETPVGAGQAGFSCAREIPFSSFCLDLALSFSSSLALWIAPRAQCGVINAAAAALCSDRVPPLLPTLPLATARSLIGDACILKIFIDFCGLSLSCFFAVCRCFYFVSFVFVVVAVVVVFLACIRFRKCRVGCVSVGNLPHAAFEMDMSDSNRNRPPGAAKRSAAAAQTIGISCSPSRSRSRQHQASASPSPSPTASASASASQSASAAASYKLLRRFGSLTAISFNFSGDDAQMISAQFLAQIAFHLRPEKCL